ncbi:hypothetical protein [Azospirillum halopraeferens]|uniref:hypothetical protein n=1 Tax=Azospirillum halopraeferens TaxID=34010 RepID=UPI000414BB25|nr:hypothetical protein [Azospirillum halopraeferens]
MHTRLTWTVDLDGHRARSHQAEVAFEALDDLDGFALRDVRVLDADCALTAAEVGEDALMAVAAAARRRRTADLHPE